MVDTRRSKQSATGHDVLYTGGGGESSGDNLLGNTRLQHVRHR